ncbi:MAG: ATP-binding cassette domain-containing protein [Actinomycetota bacterium]|nr:ATP-binding cassette domain-containing protein [Actinomycetota bacterium]
MLPDPAPPGARVLEVRGATVRRGDAVLLDRVDVTVRAGERWVLLGGNGAGKSTLLALLGARTFPTEGSVEVFGRRLGRVAVQALWPAIGQVHSGHVPTGRLTARQVVLTGASGTGALPLRPTPSTAARWTAAPWTAAPSTAGPPVALQERVARLCADVGLDRVADRPWVTLSAGERARALVARALVNDPPLLLLDEPAAGLDLPAREALVAALDGLAADRPDRAQVLVTHHLEELPASTTSALLLRHGRVLAAGPVGEVLRDAPLSDCFGVPLRVRREDGRWTARSAPYAGGGSVPAWTAGTGPAMSNPSRERSAGATGGLPGANAAPQNSELSDDERDETVAMADVAPVDTGGGDGGAGAVPPLTGHEAPVAPGDTAPVVPEYAGVADRGVVSSVGEHDPAAGDVVDVLRAEHRKLEGVFGEVLQALDAGDRDAVRLRWGGVVREVLEHERAEERVVLPLVQDAAALDRLRAGQGPLVARLQEQDELTSEAGPDQVRETVDLARQHLLVVDEVVLPVLERLPAPERMRLGEDLRQVMG